MKPTRRQFIKISGAGLGTVALGSLGFDWAFGGMLRFFSSFLFLFGDSTFCKNVNLSG